MKNPVAFWARDLGLGLVVGVFSGFFGVGGGIILVPILVLLFRMGQKSAQATSLVAVGLGAVSGAITYALGESVVWASVGFVVAGGLLGTWLGSLVVVKIRARWLQVAFALLLVVVALRLILGAEAVGASGVVDLTVQSIVGYLVAGAAMGFFSALLGIGGGVIIIPLLVVFFGFTPQLAAGTSLVVMVPLALFGAWRLSSSGATQWGQGLRLGAGAVIGAVVGASVALVVAPEAMGVAFAAVLLVAAIQMVIASFRPPRRGDSSDVDTGA